MYIISQLRTRKPTESTLFELKATPVGEIGGNMLQKQFFQMLPTDFTKQEAIQQAEVLGVNQRTMERWLVKLIQSSNIQHVAHGEYHKVS